MENNPVLVTDFYEFSMAYAYFKQNRHEDIAYFDMFVRSIPEGGGYYVFNGLHKLINFIDNFKFDEDQLSYLKKAGNYDDDFIDYLRNMKLNIDMYAMPEGTPAFPHEPVITVRGTYIQAQIIESYLLQSINYSSLIATKASRMVSVDPSKTYLEFGTRRAHGEDASIEGARAAILAGFDGTACTEAGLRYDVPVSGTMAHSYIQLFDNEYDAFLEFAQVHPDNCVLLVDTYNTLKSGIPNAIRVAKEYLIPNGYKLKGIRLDSGDLSYLSKEARKLLDNAGLHDTEIVVSNSLDEHLIKDLLDQGAQIDAFGVGERLITSRSHPVMGGVYKVVASEIDNVIVPTIKLSDTIEKITNPGYKRVWRFYDKDTDKAIADLIALHDEYIPEDEYELFSPTEPWKRKIITNYYYKELQVPIYAQGKRVYEMPSLKEVRKYHQQQMQTLWPEVTRLLKPHQYYVDLSQKLFDLKNELIAERRNADK